MGDIHSGDTGGERMVYMARVGGLCRLGLAKLVKLGPGAMKGDGGQSQSQLGLMGAHWASPGLPDRVLFVQCPAGVRA